MPEELSSIEPEGSIVSSPIRGIDFQSSESQCIGDLGDIAKYYEGNDPGRQYVVPRPVYYNVYGSGHITDEEHVHRLEWLIENQRGLIPALQNPDYIEKILRFRSDGHYSSTQIVELHPGDKNDKRFLAIAVSLSDDPNSGYHQITTIFPQRWTDIYYSNGTIKPKYKKVK